MLQRREHVTKKISRKADDPPQLQKDNTHEKLLLNGAREYNADVMDFWKNYNRCGLDITGHFRKPMTDRKPFENYYHTNKKHVKKTEYDRHYNTPFFMDPKVFRDPIKPWQEVLDEIAKEENERAVQVSINRTYYREPRFTDNYLEPVYRHALAVASYKYRKGTGIFPKLDKYSPLNSSSMYIATASHQFTMERDC